MKGLQILIRTLKGEVAVELITGLVAFGIGELLLPHSHVLPGMELLVPRSHVLATTFGLVAGAIAGALDTLYFHLLFLLREAPLHAAEGRYVHSIEDARRRLADGSIRLREALIRRFEADYQRPAAAARVDGRSRRQLREARRRRTVRFWVVEDVIPGSQLTAASASAKADPDLLEKWTDYVDALVDTRLQFQRRQSFVTNFANRFRSGYVAEQMLKDSESAKGKT